MLLFSLLCKFRLVHFMQVFHIHSLQCIACYRLVHVKFCWFPEPHSLAFGKPSLFNVCSCIFFISSVFFGRLLYCNSFLHLILGIYFVSIFKLNSFAGQDRLNVSVWYAYPACRSGPSPLQERKAKRKLCTHKMSPQRKQKNILKENQTVI